VAAVARSFFATLPTHLFAPMLADGFEIEIPARTVASPSLYRSQAALVLEGVARLYVSTPGGREATVGYRRQGDFLFSCIESSPPMRIQALTACRAWLIPMASFERALNADPRVGSAVANYAGARLYATVSDFRFSLFATVRQRMARHLLELATVGGDGEPVAQVTVQELADAVGSVREVVSREVRDLMQERAIARVPNGYALLRPGLLRAEFAAIFDGA
jgi:CRP/FNR family transcriptional regulator